MAAMSEAMRAALRRHYLMTCARQPDKTWRWVCSCRQDGGTVKDVREAHRLFAQHRVAVRMLVP